MNCCYEHRMSIHREGASFLFEKRIKPQRDKDEQKTRDNQMQKEKSETGEDRKRGESDSGSQYFLNSFASTQLGIKAIIPGLIPNPTELAAFRDKPGWQSINKAGVDKNNTHSSACTWQTQAGMQAAIRAKQPKKLLDVNGLFFFGRFVIFFSVENKLLFTSVSDFFLKISPCTFFCVVSLPCFFYHTPSICPTSWTALIMPTFCNSTSTTLSLFPVLSLLPWTVFKKARWKKRLTQRRIAMSCGEGPKRI